MVPLNTLKSEIPKRISQWFSMKEAATYARVSKSTLRRAIGNGLLRSRKTSGKGRIIIHRSWLDAWILGFDSKRLTKPQRQSIRDLL